MSMWFIFKNLHFPTKPQAIYISMQVVQIRKNLNIAKN